MLGTRPHRLTLLASILLEEEIEGSFAVAVETIFQLIEKASHVDEDEEKKSGARDQRRLKNSCGHELVNETKSEFTI